MRSGRPTLFRKRQFEPIIIVTCVRWYCRFSLSLGDLKELMAERGLAVDHTTIWRWVQRYGPEIHRRLRGTLKPKSPTWHSDETFVRIAGRWLYLFRAVDGHGQTMDFYLSETRDREAAKHFLKKGLANPANHPPCVFARDGLRSYPAAIRELQGEGLMHRSCRHRHAALCEQPDRIRPPRHQATVESDAGTTQRTHRSAVASRDRGGTHDSQRPSSGNNPNNLLGQAWVFGALLGIC